MALPTINLRVSSINLTFGVDSPKDIFRKVDGTLRTTTELSNIVTGTLSGYCPGSTQWDKLTNLRNDRNLSYFKGYYDDSACNLWDIECYANGFDQTFNLGLTGYWDLDISFDGRKLYALRYSVLRQYSLGGVNDISSPSLDYTLDLSNETTSARGLYITKDGGKAFVLTLYGYLYQYNLSTPYELSTASYYTYTELFRYNSNLTSLFGIVFSDDGLNAYITKEYSNLTPNIYEVTLGSPFLASAVNGVNKISMPTSSQIQRGVRFNPDGSSIYRNHTDTGFIHQYFLNTNFDPSSHDGTYKQLSPFSGTDAFCFSGNGYYLFTLEEEDMRISRVKHNLI